MLTLKNLTDPEKYIRLFLNELVLFNLLMERYKEINQDLHSAREYVDCSCRGRVVNYLNEKIKNIEEKKFIDSLINHPDPSVKAFKEELDDKYNLEQERIKERIRKINAAKDLYLIDKDKESWKKFFEFAEENIEFKSFFIIDHQDKFEVRFLN